MMALDRWLGVDTDWERPHPCPAERMRDVRIALVSAVVVVIGAELVRSLGLFEGERLGIVWQYAAMLSLAALVLVRRTHPIAVTVLSGVHMLVVGLLTPVTMSTLPMQVLYFFLIFSGVAWARDRRLLVAAVGLVVTLMVAWLAWTFAVGSGSAEIAKMFNTDLPEPVGLFGPITAAAGYTVLVNVLFFGGAIALGQVAWNGARRHAQVVEQARTIEAQSVRLRDQAVVAERLRIARELHDVVAHHVSVMGVQAAAARRVMERDPEAARTALSAVEQSSRDAVGQMRDLLGTLRTGELEADGDEGTDRSGMASAPSDRRPQPTLADLPALAEQASTPTCAVSLQVVESSPGAADLVPPPVQLSAYRVVQEALANVRRHSTARRANAVVRVDVDADRVEVEVVDDGHPRVGTSGTGLGLLGMRERAQHLGGGVEAGPRTGGAGWRVRVWFPLEGRRSAGSVREGAATQGAEGSVTGTGAGAARIGR